MSRSAKFSDFSTYKSIDTMEPMLRAQQYSFNGRIFLPPNPTPFNNKNNSYNNSNSNEFFATDGNIGTPDVLNTEYQQREQSGGLIQMEHQMEQGEATKPYDLFKGSSNAQNTNVNIISNIVVPNSLSRTFFSNDNAERIQLQIINDVLKKYQKQIGKQSYQELQIIMKSMYLQYGRNLPTDIEGQVVILNKYVVDECVRIIGPNVLQYNQYISDITSPIPIMPRSQNVSNKGYKTYDFTKLIPSTTNTIYNNLNDKV